MRNLCATLSFMRFGNFAGVLCSFCPVFRTIFLLRPNCLGNESLRSFRQQLETLALSHQQCFQIDDFL